MSGWLMANLFAQLVFYSVFSFLFQAIFFPPQEEPQVRVQLK